MQSVIHPNGGALPSHPTPRVLGKVRRQRRLEKWGTMDRACGVSGPFLFQMLEREISRTYLKHKNYFQIFVQAVIFKYLPMSTTLRSNYV